MADAFRGFVALPLSEAARDRAAAVIERLRGDGRDARWTAPENLHLTLKFLGQVPEVCLDDLRAALRHAADATAPFALTLGGLGAFPRLDRPQVVWVGVTEGEAALAALAARVEAACAPVGFPPEERPFRAHLTLGRARGERGAPAPRGLAERLRAADPVALGSIRAERFHLMRSDLTPRGPIYRVMATFDLGSAVREGAPVG